MSELCNFCDVGPRAWAFRHPKPGPRPYPSRDFGPARLVLIRPGLGRPTAWSRAVHITSRHFPLPVPLTSPLGESMVQCLSAAPSTIKEPSRLITYPYHIYFFPDITVHEPDCQPLADASFGVAKPSRQQTHPKPRQRFQEYFSLILRILNLAILNLSADILNLRVGRHTTKPCQRFQEYFSLILGILNLAILNLWADILNLTRCISISKPCI